MSFCQTLATEDETSRQDDRLQSLQGAPCVLWNTVGDWGDVASCVHPWETYSCHSDVGEEVWSHLTHSLTPADTTHMFGHTHTHTLFPVCQKSTHLPKQHTRTANGSAVGDRFLNKPFKSCEAVSSEPWNAPETSLWQFSLSLSAWRWYRVTN